MSLEGASAPSGGFFFVSAKTPIRFAGFPLMQAFPKSKH